jgi:hypothetical protein
MKIYLFAFIGLIHYFQATSQECRLNGHVRDFVTLKHVGNSIVNISNTDSIVAITRTNSNGRFKSLLLTNTYYNIKITHQDYSVLIIDSINLGGNGSVNMDFEIIPKFYGNSPKEAYKVPKNIELTDSTLSFLKNLKKRK